MRLSDTKVLVLATVALAMVAATVSLYYFSGRTEMGFTPGGILLEGFQPNKIQAVEISRGDDSVKMVRRKTKFFITNITAGNGVMYPANPKDVNELLSNCADIKLASKITENSELHPQLGVADQPPKKEKADEEDDDFEKPVVVRFLDGDGKLLYGLVKGKSADRGSGSYVRLVGKDTVYTSEDWISLDYTPTDYIEKELTDFAEDDVQEVTVTLADEKYTVGRNEDGDIELRDIPKGKTAKEHDVKSVFRALAGLSFDEVYPASDEAVKGLQWNGVYTCVLKDDKHLSYTARVAKKLKNPEKEEKKPETAPAGQPASKPADEDEKDKDYLYYVKVSAQGPSEAELQKAVDEANKALAEAKKAGKTISKEESKKKTAALDANETAKEFNALHTHWVYKISEWKAEDLCQPVAELVEDKEEEKKPETKPAGDPASKPAGDNKAAAPADAKKPADVPKEIGARHILISYKGAERSQEDRTKEAARTRVEKVLKEAQAENADFAALAKKYSDAPSADKGGDLKTFEKGVMHKNFEKAAFSLKVGGVSGIVETPFGFHIIKRTK